MKKILPSRIQQHNTPRHLQQQRPAGQAKAGKETASLGFRMYVAVIVAMYKTVPCNPITASVTTAFLPVSADVNFGISSLGK